MTADTDLFDARDKRYLVIGATGHVGSKITGLLAERGHDVTAMVRKSGMTIQDPYNGVIKYVVGDLSDEATLYRGHPIGPLRRPADGSLRTAT